MTNSPFILWLPRILTLFMAAFLSVFSMDVFSEELGFFKTVAALFMHLIPVWIVLLLLWASWKRPWIGGVLYPVLAVAYTISSWGHWDAIALIGLPLLLIGFAYWLSYSKTLPEQKESQRFD